MLLNRPAIAYNSGFSFTGEQLAEMFRLQAEANNVMSDVWRESDNNSIPYYRASHVESVEALQHVGYKWWKRIVPNVAQAKMELIDILHFAISDMLRDGPNTTVWHELLGYGHYQAHKLSEGSVLFYAIGRFVNGFENVHINGHRTYADGNEFYVAEDVDFFDFADLCEQFSFSTIMYGSNDMGILCAMFEHIGMTPNQVHAMYVGKNVLNKFRTDMGQREGLYSKIWDGREDNEHLTEYLDRLVKDNEPTSEEDIYAFLKTRHANAKTLKEA
tara:strand:- start:26865 stop:27683 length:819 start_codon:yes stop_codon:yes gene_type:complete